MEKNCWIRAGFAIPFLAQALCAADPDSTKKSDPPAPSVQQQIDQLKQGQEQILKELGEIKKLLQERPARMEVPAKSSGPEVVSVSVFGEPFKGDPKARVAIMEYSDFDCTFCAQYATNTLPLLDANYVTPGKIKYFFRDLPSPEHPNALFKARIARCAGDQGKFWEMHDYLFANQGKEGEDFSFVAQKLGMDVEKFRGCLSGENFSGNIRRSVIGAERMGIKGTPAFLVGTLTEDGRFFRPAKIFFGAESYESFKVLLDELLKGQAQK